MNDTHLRVAVFLGPGASLRDVQPFLGPGIEARDSLEGSDAALVFGGDGTVHRHLSGLHERSIPVLVVPTGSGNDFARSLGVRNRQTALRAWRRFCSDRQNVREIDLGVLDHDGQRSFFCCVTSVGLDAGANERANRMPAWLRRTAGYVVAGVLELLSFTPLEFCLTTESVTVRREAFFVAVGNAHRYGGGMKIVPRAALDDGLLDICLVGRMNKLKVLFCIPTIFFGAHTSIREVEYFQARTVRVETARPLAVFADGEPAGRVPVEITLVRRGLKVIAPA